jgi:hypothetical protein
VKAGVETRFTIVFSVHVRRSSGVEAASAKRDTSNGRRGSARL